VPASKRLRIASLVLTILAAAAAAAGQTRRAVLVGIDKYTLPASSSDVSRSTGRPRDAWTDLEGSVNDVEAVRQVLVSRFGFKDADIHVLENDAATSDRIVGEIRRWLLDAAAPGDVSFFFYAGHGSQVRNSKSSELDKLDETIVPIDATTGHPDLRDKQLGQHFNDILDKDVQLTVAFDSCHSGGISRGALRAIRVRGVAPDMRDVADPAAPPALESRGALVLTATQSHQNAFETIDDDHVPHGVFTWALLKTLRTLPANASVERVFLSVRGLMQSVNGDQQPDLGASPARRQAALFGAAAADQRRGSVIAVQSVDADGTVYLQGGLAAGIRQNTELRPVDRSVGTTLRVVQEDGVSLSRAVATSGHATALQPGMLLEVTRWAAPHGPTLRVWLGGLKLDLQLGAGSANDAIEVLPSPAGADYMLVSRRRGTIEEYAWERPLPGDPRRAVPMPIRTDWVGLNPASPAPAARQLEHLALRLGIVRSWLQLESPADNGTFPFHLALMNSASGQLWSEGPTREGEQYALVMAPEGDHAQPLFTRRYVYVFALDSAGGSTLLYPSAAAGGGGKNFLPPRTADGNAPKGPMTLGSVGFTIQAPFGIDTFVMLTTRTPLPDPGVLEGAAALTRALQPAGADPLARLLAQVGAGTRSGPPPPTQLEWSIERLTIESVPATAH
jgi:hypothetical protein